VKACAYSCQHCLWHAGIGEFNEKYLSIFVKPDKHAKKLSQLHKKSRKKGSVKQYSCIDQ